MAPPSAAMDRRWHDAEAQATAASRSTARQQQQEHQQAATANGVPEAAKAAESHHAETLRSLSLVLLSLALLPVTGVCILLATASQLLQRAPKASAFFGYPLSLAADGDDEAALTSEHRPIPDGVSQDEASDDNDNDSDSAHGNVIQRNDGNTQRGKNARITPNNAEKQQQHRQCTVLVTGVGMAKGLTLARAFYQCGHRVVGADVENHGIPCSGRFSRSLSRFYTLAKPNGGGRPGQEKYIRSLVDIIEAEDVDLWVSCSGVSSAAEDAEAKQVIEARHGGGGGGGAGATLGCKCIQFDVATTMELHEKDTFMRAGKRLGLPVPETHNVTSHEQALEVLKRGGGGGNNDNNNRSFILKTVGVDDTHRGNMTLLPLPSWAETERYVARLPITKANPWIVQQFIPGGQEYCTHALVVRNEVRCFTACPSAELLMHYEALGPDSALYRAMLDFTRQYVARNSAEDGVGEMTGHLSFDFMVEDVAVSAEKYERRLYAIECNPRAHTAAVLFAQHGPAMQAMVEAYISAIDQAHRVSPPGGSASSKAVDALPVSPSEGTLSRYWLAHDLVELVLQPLIRLVGLGNLDAGRELVNGFVKLLEHVLTWKEGTFAVWDPMPAFWLYHVYWPLTILFAWWNGVRWSRVNVSTTKMFLC